MKVNYSIKPVLKLTSFCPIQLFDPEEKIWVDISEEYAGKNWLAKKGHWYGCKDSIVFLGWTTYEDKRVMEVNLGIENSSYYPDGIVYYIVDEEKTF